MSSKSPIVSRLKHVEPVLNKSETGPSDSVSKCNAFQPVKSSRRSDSESVLEISPGNRAGGGQKILPRHIFGFGSSDLDPASQIPSFQFEPLQLFFFARGSTGPTGTKWQSWPRGNETPSTKAKTQNDWSCKDQLRPFVRKIARALEKCPRDRHRACEKTFVEVGPSHSVLLAKAAAEDGNLCRSQQKREI